ncbi:uncharacterized protein CTHT_0058470 [Thermochaetoides thermophila DSM 1495]|uniref:Uncharacterized protein n=1 Tax=Chaetomium thermophilum (strain DSM 1495 / CBS 144.50 / IMI 039719) TaxID=759272 RepID=G0SCU6_CHATD|nr:hypothetical protein CTHT_0058470 [Thermochaetoides thermophila DSM 1495]EGS19222.1 hypothetical protein CTHT_0058470 [Thermochaetoides thermophila DSM 1495]
MLSLTATEEIRALTEQLRQTNIPPTASELLRLSEQLRALSDQLRELSEQARATAATASSRRPSMFLELAPSTSDSYPRPPRVDYRAPTQAQPHPVQNSIQSVKRRTSSLSSEDSSTASRARLRFLKLNPVHWGEHLDDHKGDFHDVAVE